MSQNDVHTSILTLSIKATDYTLHEVSRLIEENGQYAMLSACAAGAHGHAMIIKKYEA